MPGDRRTVRRRRFFTSGVALAVLGTSGCLRLDTESQDTGPAEPSTAAAQSDVDAAQFEFEYEPAGNAVTITYTGGGSLIGRNLQVRTTAGTEVPWPQLGSTVAAPDEPLERGARATLGPDVLNWEQPVERSERIRVVYTGTGAPATLDRFQPGATDTNQSQGDTPTSGATPTTDASGEISRRNADGEVYQIGRVVDQPDSLAAGTRASVTIEIRTQIRKASDNIVYGAVGSPDGAIYGLERMDGTGTGTVTVSLSIPADAIGTVLWTWVPAISDSQARSRATSSFRTRRTDDGPIALPLGQVQ